MLEFEELLPSYFRSRLRTGHKVVHPYLKGEKKKKYAHKNPEYLDPVFDRKAHQASKYEIRSGGRNDHTGGGHDEHSQYMELQVKCS